MLIIRDAQLMYAVFSGVIYAILNIYVILNDYLQTTFGILISVRIFTFSLHLGYLHAFRQCNRNINHLILMMLHKTLTTAHVEYHTDQSREFCF